MSGQKEESDAVKIPAARGDEKEKEKNLDDRQKDDADRQAALLAKPADNKKEPEELVSVRQRRKGRAELQRGVG
jgi:hypothetical protein